MLVAPQPTLSVAEWVRISAFEVDYESASQFSREYSRFFGQPPMRDIKSRRQAISAATMSVEKESSCPHSARRQSAIRLRAHPLL